MTKKIATYLTLLLLTASCISEDDFANTPNGNFEALWQLIDERYCFFEQANEEFGPNWDAVYNKYKPLAYGCTDEIQLFDVLSEMLGELRDGHVNLTSPYGTSYYWDWSSSYPANFSDSLQRNYLGTDFRMTNGIRYTTLNEEIGYIYAGSFSGSFSIDNLSVMLYNLKETKALILDIRNNGGGMITSAERLASMFTDKKVHCGYIQHKTGKGHADLSKPEKIHITPSGGVTWLRPVILLTNRSVFSAANHFVMIMRELPHVIVVGDKTGGGSGMPLNSILPNGWSVRLSACPMLDTSLKHTEFGIDPDVKVDIKPEDWNNGRDTIIETAKEIITLIYKESEENKENENDKSSDKNS